MARQTYPGPVQWLVIDDGDNASPRPKGSEYYRRRKEKYDSPCTIALNYRYALPLVRGDIVVFIDDDDWYSPTHIDACVNGLNKALICGGRSVVYYHVGARNWCELSNEEHASMCQTAMRSNVLSYLADILDTYRGKFVDLNLWPVFSENEKHRRSTHTVIGIKGMPGPGIVTAHETMAGDNPHALNKPVNEDRSLQQLKRWIGEDAKHYAKWFQPSTSAHRSNAV